MRVERCYIFGFANQTPSYDNETKKVTQGLHAKYSGRCGTTTMDFVTRSGEFKAIDRLPPQYYSAPATGAQAFKRRVGVYLVFHSLHEFPSAASVQVCISTRLSSAELKDLSKLVLVVCDGAGDDVDHDLFEDQSAETLEAIEGSKRSALLNVVLELNRAGIRPKVAGWEGFVSALPHQPTNTFGDLISVYSNPRTKAATKLTSEQIVDPAKVGKKIGHKRHFGLIDQEHRSRRKRVYYLTDDGLQVNDNSGWSDKE